MNYLKLFKNHEEYESFVSGGTMVKPNVSHCITENEMHYSPHTFADEYLTFVAKESGTFTFEPQNNNIVSYSTDGGETWTEGNSVEVNNGDKVLWKGTMTPSSNGVGTFSSTADFDVQGNVMSLLYGDNFKGQTDLTGKNNVFNGLFGQNMKIKNAENLSLPATTLANYCYQYMFRDCANLTTAPVLPAKILTESCYSNMFTCCYSLTVAPELPATTLEYGCYSNMFSDCSSLTTAPELPAVTLTEMCYESMFLGCTSLTTAPELPATTLADYCYGGMFNGCTSLNYIKAMFTTAPGNTYTQNWVNGVAASGTFVKNAAATWTTTGANGIPTGWTVQTASV